MKETIAYLNSLLTKGDTIVIGLSGGPDSMCLLDIINRLNKNITIICAHINHNIREESVDEMKFIESYCRQNNFILETTTFAKKSEDKNYNELELREKRYEYFKKIIDKYQSPYLFTAHHGDDLIETIQMRITRGSNLKGYSGFQVSTKKDTYQIIRPLIFMTKDEIMAYVKEHNIPYVLDKTNEQDNYTRNRYRHHLLPFLKQENPNIHLKYLKFSRELTRYYQFIDRLVQTEIVNRYANNILDLTDFKDVDPLIQTKIIEYILDNNYEKNLYLVNDKHVQMILDIITNPRPNININLPDQLKISKSYNKLKISRSKEVIKPYNIQIKEETVLPNGHVIKRIAKTDSNTNNYIKLNSNEIKLPLYVRNRNNGDKMIVKNMKDYKKLKDIYINSKLTKEERDNQPIVVDSNNEILWLPGLKKSQFDKSKTGNYDIILWYN